MKKHLLTIAVLGLCAFNVQAAGNAAAGKAKSAVCASCHGQNGVSVNGSYPNLAGQHAPYLESALKAYRDKKRSGGLSAVMQPMAASLTDQDIANLAAYYSSLKP